jgi:hypothetical protein
MKLLTALFAMVMIVTILAVAALVQLVITLLPYLAVAVLVTVVVHARRRVQRPVVAAGWPGSGYPAQMASQWHYRVGAPTPVTGGWVMAPVWVAPTPGPRVIHAEFIRDRD